MNKKSIMYILSAMTLTMMSLLATPVFGQEDVLENKEQTFRFVYIAPDRTVDIPTITSELKTLKDNTTANGYPAVFYLANGESPVIVEFNIGKNNQEDYERQLKYMIENNTSWRVESTFDRKRVENILSGYNVVDSNGNLTYSSTELSFHVGKNFWDNHWNEKLIGAIFFDLNVAKYIGTPAFKFNVFFYCPPAYDSNENYSREKPFGELNPDGINDKVTPIRKQTR